MDRVLWTQATTAIDAQANQASDAAQQAGQTQSDRHQASQPEPDRPKKAGRKHASLQACPRQAGKTKQAGREASQPEAQNAMFHYTGFK